MSRVHFLENSISNTEILDKVLLGQDIKPYVEMPAVMLFDLILIPVGYYKIVDNSFKLLILLNVVCVIVDHLSVGPEVSETVKSRPRLILFPF